LGRSKKGDIVQKLGLAIRSKNITEIAAICDDQILYYEVLEGNINADRFSYFIDNLANARDQKHLPPNSILVMDNVGFHRNAAVKEITKIKGFERNYLPAYIPFLNPIEAMFNKWKHYAKRDECNTTQELEFNILNDHLNVTLLHCQNYFCHCGTNAISILAGQRLFKN
jgi:transposase